MEQKKNNGWRVNFSNAQNQQIAEYAEKNSMTKSAVVREAVAEYFQKRAEIAKKAFS